MPYPFSTRSTKQAAAATRLLSLSYTLPCVLRSAAKTDDLQPAMKESRAPTPTANLLERHGAKRSQRMRKTKTRLQSLTWEVEPHLRKTKMRLQSLTWEVEPHLRKTWASASAPASTSTSASASASPTVAAAAAGDDSDDSGVEMVEEKSLDEVLKEREAIAQRSGASICLDNDALEEVHGQHLASATSVAGPATRTPDDCDGEGQDQQECPLCRRQLPGRSATAKCDGQEKQECPLREHMHTDCLESYTRCPICRTAVQRKSMTNHDCRPQALLRMAPPAATASKYDDVAAHLVPPEYWWEQDPRF